jgi:hypothetical protein
LLAKTRKLLAKSITVAQKFPEIEKVATKIQKVARTYYVNQEIYTIFARSDELLVINNRHL